MIEVREARLDDAGAIAAAHVEGWRVAYRGVVSDSFLDHPDFLPIRRRGWERRLREGPPPDGDADNRILSVLAHGDVAGFGHVGRQASPDVDPPALGEIYGF